MANFVDVSHELPAGFSSGRLVDVDGDGDLDVVRSLELQWRNDGGGMFFLFTGGPPSPAGATFLLMEDFDQDGDVDAMWGVDGQDLLYRNDGSGAFTLDPAAVPLGTPVALQLVSGDFDGDGDVDVLVRNDAFGGPGLLEPSVLRVNDGVGVFTDVPLSVPMPNALLGAVDLNGDGAPDLLAGDRIYFNVAGGFPTFTATALGSGRVLLGDVDEDADVDVVTLHETGGQVGLSEMFLNDGAGVLQNVTPSPYASGAPPIVTNAMALGDLDGDGDPDAVFGGRNVDALFLNQGDGVFSDATATGFQAPFLIHSSDVALGDVDADGDLDIVFADEGLNVFDPPRQRYYENQGGAVFGYATPFNPAPAGPEAYAVALGDVNGDGDLDAVFGTNAVDNGLLFLGDGAGAFSDASSNLPVATFSGATVDVALGDVDNDGDLDLVQGNSSDANLVLPNDGTGIFGSPSSSLPADVESTQEVSLSDLDGDGDLDLLVTNFPSAGEHSRLYENGGGSLTDISGTLPRELFEARSLRVADLDLDGHLDLVGDGQVLFRGDGALNFAWSPRACESHDGWPFFFEVADLDGDEDPDVMTRERILFHQERHLSWGALPKQGAPLRLSHRGEPDTFWFLFSSSARTSMPQPPFGTLFLDPAGTVPVASGRLDRSGQDVLVLPSGSLPPSAAGALLFQSLVGDPLRWSNLEVVTLSAF